MAQKQQVLADKQTALTSAQAKLATEKAALTPLQDAVDAQADVATAQSAYDNAVKAQSDAQAAADYANSQLWDDAKKCGDVITVAPVTIHAGNDLPSISITNPTTTATTNTAATEMFMMLAAMPAADTSIPAGTVATWADPAKANADRMPDGTYTEDVLVTYPDGSTSRTTVTLTVLANQAGATEITLSNGYKIVNGRVVDANGNPIAGWTVKNGRVYNAEGQLVADFSYSNANATIIQGKQTTTKELPQTGNETHNEIAVFGLGLLTALTALLGLGVRKHN